MTTILPPSLVFTVAIKVPVKFPLVSIRALPNTTEEVPMVMLPVVFVANPPAVTVTVSPRLAPAVGLKLTKPATL